MSWPFSELPPPGPVDAAAAAVILLGALQGIVRGLSREWPRLLNMTASLAVALLGYHRGSLFLLTHSRMEESTARAAAFIGLLAGSMLTLFVARLLLRKLVTAKLDFKGNRGAGLAAAAVSASLLVFAVFYAVNLWPDESLRRVFGSRSLIGTTLTRFLPELRGAGAPLGARATGDEPAPDDDGSL